MTVQHNELIGFTTDALRREVERRAAAWKAGKCDACGRWYDETSCRSLRHGDASARWIGRWALSWGSTYLMAEHAERGDSAQVTISRYGERVMLSRDSGGGAIMGCEETQMPEGLDDRDRFEWAIKWADETLAARWPT